MTPRTIPVTLAVFTALVCLWAAYRTVIASEIDRIERYANHGQ